MKLCLSDRQELVHVYMVDYGSKFFFLSSTESLCAVFSRKPAENHSKWSDLIYIFGSSLSAMWKMDCRTAERENRENIGVFLVRSDGRLEDGDEE